MSLYRTCALTYMKKKEKNIFIHICKNVVVPHLRAHLYGRTIQKKIQKKIIMNVIVSHMCAHLYGGVIQKKYRKKEIHISRPLLRLCTYQQVSFAVMYISVGLFCGYVHISRSLLRRPGLPRPVYIYIHTYIHIHTTYIYI